MIRKLIPAYIFLLFLLIIFSFTQIDLNLTLSSFTVYQTFQQALIQLGYFNRPLNTLIFLILVSLLTVFYLLFINLVNKNKLSQRQIWRLVLISGSSLLLAYPAFSHDIFNYIFDARILAVYGKNPYFFSALDFPDDLWIRFMHWTHRRYPYGPFWLVLSLLFLILGMGKFTLTLFSFKLLALLSYFACCFLILKISKKLKVKNPQLSLALFAFNPLVLFEGLVAGHLDLVMLAFVLAGLWFLLSLKKRLAGLLWFFGAGIKFIPLVFFPALFLKFKKIKTIYFSTLTSLLTLVAYSIYKEPQPWYWLLPFGLAVLLPKASFLKRYLVLLSLLQPLTYLPFFYLGDYSYPVRLVKFASLLVPLGLVVLPGFYRPFSSDRIKE